MTGENAGQEAGQDTQDMSPEQLAALQKQNCIFCRIVSGEVESKKVFENEKFLAILDIRPAAPGHVLFLPKQHVPILPLLAEEDMFDYLELATELARAVQDAMISQRVTMFMASGYAAGQQAPHLMIHVIPREHNDGLDVLDLKQETVEQADALALVPVFTQVTTQALRHRKREDLLRIHQIHKKEAPQPESALPSAEHQRAVPDSSPHTSTGIAQGATTHAAATSPAPAHDPLPVEEVREFGSHSEALEQVLAMNPDLRRLIIAQPDLVTDYVKKSPKLSRLFEGVDIHALSLVLQRQESKAPLERVAANMTENELFAFIDGNEGLRTWVLENPEELVQHLPENPRLSAFFAGTDVLEIAKRFTAWRQAKGGA